jgi:hypothetical protein
MAFILVVAGPARQSVIAREDVVSAGEAPLSALDQADRRMR